MTSCAASGGRQQGPCVPPTIRLPLGQALAELLSARLPVLLRIRSPTLPTYLSAMGSQVEGAVVIISVFTGDMFRNYTQAQPSLERERVPELPPVR